MYSANYGPDYTLWLIICCFTSHSRIFCFSWDVTVAADCIKMVFGKREGIFIVPIFIVPRDTGTRFLGSHLKLPAEYRGSAIWSHRVLNQRAHCCGGELITLADRPEGVLCAIIVLLLFKCAVCAFCTLCARSDYNMYMYIDVMSTKRNRTQSPTRTP